MTNRIDFLDGLRGLAIILVLLFHAFARWPEITPYGDKYAAFPVFHYGYLGVYLFFMISGYVILMTLRKCSGFGDFLWRRWLRLFPAMLICSVFLYATVWLLPERPGGIPNFKDLLPGLLFVAPSYLNAVTHAGFDSLEGGFWTLYKEAIFYLVFGFAYFRFGEARAILLLFAIAILGAMFFFIQDGLLGKVFHAFQSTLFGWFLIGCLIYRIVTETTEGLGQRDFAILVLSAVIAPFVLADLRGDVALLIAAYLCILLFWISQHSIFMQRILTSRMLLFTGFVSYPLYLINENIMIALIIKLGHVAPLIPALLLPVLPIIVIYVLAYVVARYLEKPLKQALVFARQSSVQLVSAR